MEVEDFDKNFVRKFVDGHPWALLFCTANDSVVILDEGREDHSPPQTPLSSTHTCSPTFEPSIVVMVMCWRKYAFTIELGVTCRE